MAQQRAVGQAGQHVVLGLVGHLVGQLALAQVGGGQSGQGGQGVVVEPGRLVRRGRRPRHQPAHPLAGDLERVTDLAAGRRARRAARPTQCRRTRSACSIRVRSIEPGSAQSGAWVAASSRPPSRIWVSRDSLTERTATRIVAIGTSSRARVQVEATLVQQRGQEADRRHGDEDQQGHQDRGPAHVEGLVRLQRERRGGHDQVDQEVRRAGQADQQQGEAVRAR